MKINEVLGVIGILFIMISCGEKEDEGCKSLTWESSSSADSINIDLKSGAGDQCENYSDYYDADLNQIIAKIQSMKFVLNRKCYEMTTTDSDPEEVEVVCPEFVPATIEFGELVSCSFGTPPAENMECSPSPLRLLFENEEFLSSVEWTFLNVKDPKFIFGSSDYMGNRMFSASRNDLYFMSGYFNDETLTSATIVFTWTEDEVEKTLEFGAVVETKE